MAQPTVSISSPTGNTAVPCTASGSAQPSAGYTLQGMTYTIDSAPGGQITNFVAMGGSWSFTLSTTDCPTVGDSYLLTVYAGDDSGAFGMDSVQITRTS
jgi:hypothetical protein